MSAQLPPGAPDGSGLIPISNSRPRKFDELWEDMNYAMDKLLPRITMNRLGSDDDLTYFERGQLQGPGSADHERMVKAWRSKQLIDQYGRFDFTSWLGMHVYQLYGASLVRDEQWSSMAAGWKHLRRDLQADYDSDDDDAGEEYNPLGQDDDFPIEGFAPEDDLLAGFWWCSEQDNLTQQANKFQDDWKAQKTLAELGLWRWRHEHERDYIAIQDEEDEEEEDLERKELEAIRLSRNPHLNSSNWHPAHSDTAIFKTARTRPSRLLQVLTKDDIRQNDTAARALDKVTMYGEVERAIMALRFMHLVDLGQLDPTRPRRSGAVLIIARLGDDEPRGPGSDGDGPDLIVRVSEAFWDLEKDKLVMNILPAFVMDERKLPDYDKANPADPWRVLEWLCCRPRPDAGKKPKPLRRSASLRRQGRRHQG